MKKLILLLVVMIIAVSVSAQNITNTLGTNGSFIVKDATNTFFTLVQSTGNVGIGSNVFDATNPEKLKVDVGVTTSKNVISGYGSINSYLQLNIKNSSNGNSASSDIVATNDIGTESKGYIDMGINSSTYNDAAYTIGGMNDAYIYCSGNDGGSPVGGNLSIGTSSSGSVIKFHTAGTLAANERMRIDANGNVGIGTTTPAYKFQVKIGSYEGHVASDGAWAKSSDIRLKKNINSIINSLECIMNLNPVRYDMKNEENSKSGNHFGFIAQEMEKYLPEFVDTDNEGMKSIKYAEITSILTGAVKEQQVMIDSQKKDIEQLKADVKELKAMRTTQSAGMDISTSGIGFWALLSFVAGSVVVIVIKRKRS